MQKILIAGCGYLGRAVLSLFQEAGWEVTALTRTEASAQAIRTEYACRAVACDVDDLEQLRAIKFPYFDAAVVCVSTRGGTVSDYIKVYFGGIMNLALEIEADQFLFTSSSAVYAQDNGSWVTEKSKAEPDPVSPAAILKLAESEALDRYGIVVRLPGIYGPGRARLLDRFLDGTAVIEGDGSRFLNQIHRDDAASAIFHILNLDNFLGVINVSDGASPSQLEFYKGLAEHFERPLPPFVPVDSLRRRVVTNKRVSNAKLRGLGWTPKYPTFLDAIDSLGCD